MTNDCLMQLFCANDATDVVGVEICQLDANKHPAMNCNFCLKTKLENEYLEINRVEKAKTMQMKSEKC